MKNKSILFFFSLVLLIITACNSDKTAKLNETSAIEETPVNDMSTFDSLNQLIKEQPSNPLLFNQRANFYLVAGDRNNALSDVNQALQLDTLNANIWVTLADIYFASERFVDSREILLKAIQLDPQNTAALLKLARLYFIYREYQTSMSYINKALEANPLLEDAYFLKAMSYAEGGDTAKAIYNYQKSVDINPDFYDAWVELGNIYQADGNELAEQYFRNALELDTNNAHALYIMAFYYQQAGRFEDSEKYYKSLLNKEENKNALFNLGYINMVYLENFPEAISYFQKALNIDPDYHDALFNLAYSLELSGDKADARVKYKELLKKVPNHEGALYQLNQLEN